MIVDARPGLLRSLRFATLLGLLLSSGGALAFDGRELWISASGGWSRLTPLRGLERPGVDGGGGGARVMFALSDAFGLAVEGTASRYRGFASIPPPVPASEEGETNNAENNGVSENEEAGEAPPVAPGPPTAGITCRDLALTLVYAVDVFALVPQIAMGLVVARLTETRGDSSTVAWDLLWRIDAGLDYRPARRFALGLWATFDTRLTGASPWSGRTSVSLRLTIPLGGGGDETPVSSAAGAARSAPADHSSRSSLR